MIHTSNRKNFIKKLSAAPLAISSLFCLGSGFFALMITGSFFHIANFIDTKIYQDFLIQNNFPEIEKWPLWLFFSVCIGLWILISRTTILKENVDCRFLIMGKISLCCICLASGIVSASAFLIPEFARDYYALETINLEITAQEYSLGDTISEDVNSLLEELIKADDRTILLFVHQYDNKITDIIADMKEASPELRLDISNGRQVFIFDPNTSLTKLFIRRHPSQALIWILATLITMAWVAYPPRELLKKEKRSVSKTASIPR